MDYPEMIRPLGYVYYEIPAGAVNGDLVLTADIAFTAYEQIFEDIDPAKVGEYNTSDPEYLLYTRSERNIEITDAIREKAREIVGDETNPHLQAQMIYYHIIETYPYSHVPHASLDAREPKVAESTYMFETGHGDCGTQSMLFAALCRSPRRATGSSCPRRNGLRSRTTMPRTSTPHAWSSRRTSTPRWTRHCPATTPSSGLFGRSRQSPPIRRTTTLISTVWGISGSVLRPWRDPGHPFFPHGAGRCKTSPVRRHILRRIPCSARKWPASGSPNYI